MSRARAVVTPMPERLAAARREVDDAVASLALARKTRNQLVVEAVDSGELSQRAVAAAAGITVPRVSAILGQSDDDDDE